MQIQGLSSLYNINKTPSFMGKSGKEIANDKYRACVATNIWAEKMYVPTPENEEEKEALREVLTHRANLEKYVRLSNEEFRLKLKIAELRELKENDPSNPRITVLEKELKAKGNLTSVLSTMEKQKTDEIKRNQASYNYLTDLDKLTFELLDKKILKATQLEKFYHNARKHGLNPDGEYNAKDLLLILSGGTPEKSVKKAEEIKQSNLSDEEQAFIDKMSIEYEKLLQQLVNIFSENKNHSIDVSTARQQLKLSNLAFFDRHKNIHESLIKAYENIEKKYQETVAKITPIPLWSPDELWKNMDDIEKAIGIQMVDVAAIRKQLKETPDNITYQKILEGKEVSLESFKANWGLFLEKSIEVEEKNQESAKKFGVLDEYKYLTEENSIIKRHRALYEIYKENGNRMPDEHWLAVFAQEFCTNGPRKL